MKNYALTLLLLLILNACSKKEDEMEASSTRGFDLQNTEWEASESRVLRFIDFNVATYRNLGNSYVLNYKQTNNDVVFTISGNSNSDWTGTVSQNGSTFTLYKDSYTIIFKPKSVTE